MWRIYLPACYSLLCFTLSGITGNTYYHCPRSCSEGSLRQMPLSSTSAPVPGRGLRLLQLSRQHAQACCHCVGQNRAVRSQFNQCDHITHFLGKPVIWLQLTFSVPLTMQENTWLSVEQVVSAYARRLVSARCNQKTFLIWGNFPVLVFKMEVLLSWFDDT